MNRCLFALILGLGFCWRGVAYAQVCDDSEVSRSDVPDAVLVQLCAPLEEVRENSGDVLSSSLDAIGYSVVPLLSAEKSIQKSALKTSLGLDRWVVVQLPKGQIPREATDQLSGINCIERVEPITEWRKSNVIRVSNKQKSNTTLLPLTGSPTDPQFTNQWYLTPSNPHNIGLLSAWDTTLGHSTTIIAILGSGVYSGHEDLGGHVLSGYDFVSGPGSQSCHPSDDCGTLDNNPSDWLGFGTLSAGIAAAKAYNAGIVGICPECSILPVRVAYATLGLGQAFREHDLVRGIIYAVDQGAKVIEIDVDAPAISDCVRAAVEYARLSNVVVVSGAGQSLTSIESFPAALPGVLSVAATDRSDARWVFSNFGNWVKISAPGEDLVSLGNLAPSLYQTFDASFGASAIVAGVTGLMYSANSSLLPEHITQALQATALPLNSLLYPGMGAGRLQAGEALGQVLLVPQQYPDLNSAVSAAPDNSIILVAPGNYSISSPVIVSNKQIKIVSTDGPSVTRINLQSFGNVVFGTGSRASSLEGFAIDYWENRNCYTGASSQSPETICDPTSLIEVSGDSLATIKNNRLFVHAPTTWAIRIKGSAQASVLSNTINYNAFSALIGAGGVIVADSAQVTFARNDVQADGGTGLSISNFSVPIVHSIRNNIFSGALYGIYLSGATGGELVNNTIVDNEVAGLSLNGITAPLQLKNNIFATIYDLGTGVGIQCQSVTPVPVSRSYNDIFNGVIGTCPGFNPLEPTELSVDPKFDPWQVGYHIKYDSPLVDAGAPSDSYSLEPYPNGSRINIGGDGNTETAASKASNVWLKETFEAASPKIVSDLDDTGQSAWIVQNGRLEVRRDAAITNPLGALARVANSEQLVQYRLNLNLESLDSDPFNKFGIFPWYQDSSNYLLLKRIGLSGSCGGSWSLKYVRGGAPVNNLTLSGPLGPGITIEKNAALRIFVGGQQIYYSAGLSLPNGTIAFSAFDGGAIAKLDNILIENTYQRPKSPLGVRPPPIHVEQVP